MKEGQTPGVFGVCVLIILHTLELLMRWIEQVVRKFLVLHLVIFTLTPVGSAFAAEVFLRWSAPKTNADGSPLQDLAGYRVYYGESPDRMTVRVNVGRATAYTVLGLKRDTQYYFAVTAYDVSGNESESSGNAAMITAIPQGKYANDFDGDGILNDWDPDNDGDRLSDKYELEIGTSPFNADTDGDGVWDRDELSEGTDPLDGVSVIPRMKNTICADWNSFLGNMWNVFEHINRTDKDIEVQTTLFDHQGLPQSAYNFDVPASGKFDTLVHDFYGRQIDSYGRVCSHHTGGTGAIDGQMVYYKPNTNPWVQSGEFQFAMAMPMSNGRQGTQYVPFNSNHPSLFLGDWGDGVGSWVQVTSLSSYPETGTLTFYSEEGVVLSSERVEIPPFGRKDFAAHALMVRAGVAEWRPDNTQTSFFMWNGRYYYDNPYLHDSFDGAVQINATPGTSKPLYSVIDTIGRTAVLEVVNTSAAPAELRLDVYGQLYGRVKVEITIPAHGSRHIVLDQYLGGNQIGYVRAIPQNGSEIAMVTMQYGRRADGSMSYAFAVPGRIPLGNRLQGSYNTFLGQESWVVVMSPEPQQVQFRVKRPDGSLIVETNLMVEGVTSIPISWFEPADSYGTVELVPSKRDSMLAWSMRIKGDEFVLPLPFR